MNCPYLHNREFKNHLQRAHSVIFSLSKACARKLASEKALVVLDICVGNCPETYGKHPTNTFYHFSMSAGRRSRLNSAYKTGRKTSIDKRSNEQLFTQRMFHHLVSFAIEVGKLNVCDHAPRGIFSAVI